MRSVLNVHRSILGQPWRWRGLEGDVCDEGFVADDLVTRILLARGCPRDELVAHKAPSIREFLPDPSIFRDMDRAVSRLSLASGNARDLVALKTSLALLPSLRAALAEKMILDWDYLPLPDLMEANTGEGDAKKGKGKGKKK